MPPSRASGRCRSATHTSTTAAGSTPLPRHPQCRPRPPQHQSGASPSRLVPASRRLDGHAWRTTGWRAISRPATAARRPGSQPVPTAMSALPASPTTVVLPRREPDRSSPVPRSPGTRNFQPHASHVPAARPPAVSASGGEVASELCLDGTAEGSHGNAAKPHASRASAPHPRAARSAPKPQSRSRTSPMPIRSRNMPPMAQFQVRSQTARLGWSGA